MTATPGDDPRVASLIEALEDLLRVHVAAARFIQDRLDEVRADQPGPDGGRRLANGWRVLDGGDQAVTADG